MAMHELRSVQATTIKKDISLSDFIIQAFCALTEVEADDTNRVSCILDRLFCIKRAIILAWIDEPENIQDKTNNELDKNRHI